MSKCENCHSEEVYPVTMQIMRREEPTLPDESQNQIAGTYCIDCGVLELEDE